MDYFKEKVIITILVVANTVLMMFRGPEPISDELGGSFGGIGRTLIQVVGQGWVLLFTYGIILAIALFLIKRKESVARKLDENIDKDVELSNTEEN